MNNQNSRGQKRKDSPLWRHGPPDKPVLCNACGTRWRLRKTLDNYTPKHASAPKASGSEGTQSYKRSELPHEVEPAISMNAHSCRNPYLGPKNAGFDHFSAGFEGDKSNKSSSESAKSLSDSCIQMGGLKPPFWKTEFPTREKSKLKQRILSPVERLQRQLSYFLEDPDFSREFSDEVVLIYDSNRMFSTETPLGAMLLKSPAVSSTERDTKPHSSVVESEACRPSYPLAGSSSSHV